MTEVFDLLEVQAERGIEGYAPKDKQNIFFHIPMGNFIKHTQLKD